MWLTLCGCSMLQCHCTMMCAYECMMEHVWHVTTWHTHVWMVELLILVQVLPSVPTLAQLSKSVWVVLGLNPGPYTLTGTNTYLVGTGRKRVLIDTGDGRAEYVPQLEAAMAQAGVTGLQEIGEQMSCMCALCVHVCVCMCVCVCVCV